MAKGQRAHFNKQKAGHKCTTKNGKTFTLLNPHEKGCKSAVELHSRKNIYIQVKICQIHNLLIVVDIWPHKKTVLGVITQIRKNLKDKSNIYR